MYTVKLKFKYLKFASYIEVSHFFIPVAAYRLTTKIKQRRQADTNIPIIPIKIKSQFLGDETQTSISFF